MMKKMFLCYLLALELVNLDCFGMTTAKYVQIDWNDDEIRTYNECRDFYVRAKNNKLEDNESLSYSVNDYIDLLQFYIDELQYEGQSFNDRLKCSKLESIKRLLESLCQ